MQQIILLEPGKFIEKSTDEPTLADDRCALVRIDSVGICGTDLHAFHGRHPAVTYPRVLGHELGVEIVEIAKNEFGLKVGDRCAVEPYLTCGDCVACRAGKTNCCIELQCLGVHTDGGMCELMTIPIEKLHKSDKLSLEQLALVETLGIGCHAVDRAELKPDEWTLVIGAGPIGLATAQFAKAVGAKVVVMDINPSRLEFCQQQLGVDATIDSSGDANGNALEKLNELTSNDLPLAVFDCTGNQQSMTASFDFVAHGGRLVFVGIVKADITFSDPDLHRRELTLLASRNSTGEVFRRIITMIEEGQIDTDPWITHRATMNNLIEQFPAWTEPNSGCIKAMLQV